MVASTNDLNRNIEIQKCMDAITRIKYIKDFIREDVFNKVINTNKAKLILLGTTYEQEIKLKYQVELLYGINTHKNICTGIYINSI